MAQSCDELEGLLTELVQRVTALESGLGDKLSNH